MICKAGIGTGVLARELLLTPEGRAFSQATVFETVVVAISVKMTHKKGQNLKKEKLSFLGANTSVIACNSGMAT